MGERGATCQTSGPRHDLITQHYGILKSDLVIVVDLTDLAGGGVGLLDPTGQANRVVAVASLSHQLRPPLVAVAGAAALVNTATFRAVYIRWPSAECGTPSSGRRLRAGMRS